MAALTPAQRVALAEFARLVAFVDDEAQRMERLGLEPRYADGVDEALEIVGQHRERRVSA